jgi:hypothetical protein
LGGKHLQTVTTTHWDPEHSEYDAFNVSHNDHLARETSLMEGRIVDYLGGNDWKVMNDVHHTRTDIDSFKPTPGGGITDVVEWVTSKDSLGSRISAPTAVVRDNTDIVPLRNWTMAEVDKLFSNNELPYAVDLDRDPLDTDFSIWFLIVDIKDAYKLLVNIMKCFRQREWRWWRRRKYNDKSGGATPRDTAKGWHDANLQLQFGILPTVDDIKAFLSILARWKNAYDKLREQQDQIHRWRMPEMDIFDVLKEPESVLKFENNHLPGIFQVRAYSPKVEATFHRCLHYRFTCPELTGWLARVRQMIDAFGVLDPAAVWDQIPWSFMIDWFIPVGKWLHRHRPRLFPADITILDYCESIRLEWEELRDMDAYCLDLYTEQGPAGATRNYDRIASHRHTRYIRRRFKPPPQYIARPELTCDVLSWRRISIASSLLAQRSIPRFNGSTPPWWSIK